jgi:hypothetical protein
MAARDNEAAWADEDAFAERAAELATEVSEAGEPDRRRLRRLLARLTRTARTRSRAARSTAARVAGDRTRAARRGVGQSRDWLAAQVLAMAPRLKVRDQATLRAHFPGKAAEEIADALIQRAARASAAVGGAVGAWATLPFAPAAPAEVAAETVAVVGIEVKLVAELHEAYGHPATGSATERAIAYLASWAHRRGVFLVPGGLIIAARSPLMRQLRSRLARRAGRSAFSLGPLLTGAAAGAILNSRETRRLGEEVRRDLRQRAATPPGDDR